jgi:hypothetical protein
MNNGFQLSEIKPTDYRFGDGLLGSESPLVPDGQWDAYLPLPEIQNLNNIEPSACVTFATLNCVETLERRVYGFTNNWSDRFLAKISGTTRIGNDPTSVAETLRKKGCVPEADLPFNKSIDTFEKFYAPIAQNLMTLALEFPLQYSFGHSFVPSNEDSLMEALKYSPVLFSVYAWVQDENGLYFRPQGMSDGHAVMLYGYEKGEFWRIYDSYNNSGGNNLKKVRWDSLPMQAKRFTILRQIVNEKPWAVFVRWLRNYLGL